jgi:hypothetical protein
MNKNIITDCKKNIMGTIDFQGQFGTMRKAQDFIVYPMQDAGSVIHIQSDNRFGAIDLDTGKGLVSPACKGHAGAAALQLSIMDKTAVPITLDDATRLTLREAVKKTGSLLPVGNSVVQVENPGAVEL